MCLISAYKIVATVTNSHTLCKLFSIQSSLQTHQIPIFILSTFRKMIYHFCIKYCLCLFIFDFRCVLICFFFFQFDCASQCETNIDTTNGILPYTKRAAIETNNFQIKTTNSNKQRTTTDTIASTTRFIHHKGTNKHRNNCQCAISSISSCVVYSHSFKDT